MTGFVAACVAALARLASGPSVRCAEDRPCRGQCIYFANHGSHLDFVVLWAVLPKETSVPARDRSPLGITGSPAGSASTWQRGYSGRCWSTEPVAASANCGLRWTN